MRIQSRIQNPRIYAEVRDEKQGNGWVGWNPTQHYSTRDTFLYYPDTHWEPVAETEKMYCIPASVLERFVIQN